MATTSPTRSSGKRGQRKPSASRGSNGDDNDSRTSPPPCTAAERCVLMTAVGSPTEARSLRMRVAHENMRADFAMRGASLPHGVEQGLRCARQRQHRKRRRRRVGVPALGRKGFPIFRRHLRLAGPYPGLQSRCPGGSADARSPAAGAQRERRRLESARRCRRVSGNARRASRSGRQAKSIAAAATSDVGQRKRLISGQCAVLAQDRRQRSGIVEHAGQHQRRTRFPFHAGDDDDRHREHGHAERFAGGPVAFALREEAPQVPIDCGRRRGRENRGEAIAAAGRQQCGEQVPKFTIQRRGLPARCGLARRGERVQTRDPPSPRPHRGIGADRRQASEFRYRRGPPAHFRITGTGRTAPVPAPPGQTTRDTARARRTPR